jgi:hypothetical protein
MSDDRRTPNARNAPAVTSDLPRLKREGCNLLVTGAVSMEAADRLTRRLLGSPGLDRTRILVRTDDSHSVARLLPAGVSLDDPSVRRFDYSAYTARADPLASLGRDVVAAVDEFGSRPTPLVGGELRLAVTSLDPLVVDREWTAVERFLRRLTDVVVDARGMGHYRHLGSRADLPGPPPERLFDAFVDLRDREAPEQRLSIPALEPTGWTEV